MTSQPRSRPVGAMVIAAVVIAIIAVAVYFATKDDGSKSSGGSFKNQVSAQATLNNVQTSVGTESRLVRQHLDATDAATAGSLEQQMHKLDVQIVQGLATFEQSTDNAALKDKAHAYDHLYRQWVSIRDQEVLPLSRISDTDGANAIISKSLEPLEAQLNTSGTELSSSSRGAKLGEP